MNDVKIYRLAFICDVGFKKRKPLHNSLEGCYQRFWIWVNYTGARADDESNLDRRLKFSPDLRNEVARLLKLIVSSLAEGKTPFHILARLETDIHRLPISNSHP